MLFIGSFESAKSYVPSIRKSELQEMKGTTVKYKIYHYCPVKASKSVFEIVET